MYSNLSFFLNGLQYMGTIMFDSMDRTLPLNFVETDI